MLGEKILYEDCSLSPKKDTYLTYKVATDKMLIDFSWIGRGNLNQLILSNIDLPEELIKQGINKVGYEIINIMEMKFAARYCYDDKWQMIAQNEVPTGVFLPKEQEELQSNSPETKMRYGSMKIGDAAKERLGNEIKLAVEEFKNRFLEKLIGKSTRVAELFPIREKSFFGMEIEKTIGPILDEEFSIRGCAKCCNKPVIEISATTENYHFNFYYKGPEHENGFGSSLTIKKIHRDYGYAFKINENLDIDRGREEYSEFVNNLVKGYWGELREELNVSQRIKECSNLSYEDLKRAVAIKKYLEEPRLFPYKPTKRLSIDDMLR